MVSGTISPRYSRYFSPFPHGTGSLSVSQEYLALADGAARFRRGFTGPALLRILIYSINFSVRDSHPVSCSFPASFPFVARVFYQSYNPRKAVTCLVWALPASLATTTGITACFLLLQVLRCFSSLRSPLDCSRSLVFNQGGCPIRISADQCIFAAPRRFSQLITSFFASESLGIPHTPFSTFTQVRSSTPAYPKVRKQHYHAWLPFLLLYLFSLTNMSMNFVPVESNKPSNTST